MTLPVIVLAVVIVGMAYSFLTERLPIDLTAFLGLILLVLSGLIPPDQAFQGFSSPVVITLISVFFLSAGIKETGLADWAALRIQKMIGHGERINILAVTLLASFVSSFMNNVAVVALLLPTVMGMAFNGGISPARLLIPLSFGSLLGGMTTLIGTPPNLIVSDLLQANGASGFQFFDFLPFGFPLVILGALLLCVLAPVLLPAHKGQDAGRADLTKLYRLYERIFAVRIPHGCALAGRSLDQSDIGSILGAQVIAIQRGTRQILAPAPGEILEAHDTLVLGGRVADLEVLRHFIGLSINSVERYFSKIDSSDLEGVLLEAEPLVKEGTTLASLKLHTYCGILVVAVARAGAVVSRNLSTLLIKPGDRLYAFTRRGSDIPQNPLPQFRLLRRELSPEEILQHGAFVMQIPRNAPVIRLRDSRLGKLLGLTIVGIVSQGRARLALDPEMLISPGDALVVLGDAAQAARLAHLTEFEILPDADIPALESPEVALVEVVLSPRSKLTGHSLRELSFRERYDFQVLALWREGAPVRSRLGNAILHFGDALLLQGKRNKIPLLLNDPDFVVLSQSAAKPLQIKRALFVLLALGILILFPALHVQTVPMAAFMAATLVVLSKAVRMQRAYREIEWRVVFFLAALLPLGTAMTNSGAPAALAHALGGVAQVYGQEWAAIAIMLAGSVLSQLLDSSVASVLLGPVAFEAAAKISAPPQLFLMVTALSSSVAFLTPFSHKANLLVMGAGGYRAKDFFTIGLALTILAFAVILGMAYVIY